MSSALDIHEKLRDTTAEIARLERASARGPASPALATMAASLEKRKQELESQLLEVSAASGIDICSYRLFNDTRAPKLAGIAAALSDFQSMYSLVYDALKNGPKQRSRLNPEAAAHTAFDFAYSFAGSVGVVFSIPDEFVIFGNTRLDETITTIFTMVKAGTPQDILRFAQQLGRAPVRSLYRWAEDHVKFGMGAEIQWRRGDAYAANLFIQKQEFRELRETLDSTSEETIEEFEAEGELVGLDMPRHSFHFVTKGIDIHGTFLDAITPQQAVKVPAPYTAHIVKSSRIRYSTEEEDVSYFLARLDVHQGRLIT